MTEQLEEALRRSLRADDPRRALYATRNAAIAA